MFICRIGSENHRKDTNSQTWLAIAIIGEKKGFNLFLLFLHEMLVFSFHFLWFFFFFFLCLLIPCSLYHLFFVDYVHYQLVIWFLPFTTNAGIRFISKALPGLSVKNTFLLVILLAYLWSPTTMISSQEVWCQCTTTGL